MIETVFSVQGGANVIRQLVRIRVALVAWGTRGMDRRQRRRWVRKHKIK